MAELESKENAAVKMAGTTGLEPAASAETERK
jgi:hypothetical protein